METEYPGGSAMLVRTKTKQHSYSSVEPSTYLQATAATKYLQRFFINVAAVYILPQFAVNELAFRDLFPS